MAKLGLVFGALLVLGACKQGVGDRCEVNDDCESGLVCSTGQDRTCFNPAQGGPDAPPTNQADARIIVITDAPITLPDAPGAPDAAAPADAGGMD